MSELYVTNPALEPLIAAHKMCERNYSGGYAKFLAAWPEDLQANQFSLSVLQKSPQQVILAKQHAHEIRKNAASNHWTLFGSVIHTMLEHYPRGIKERRYGMVLKDLPQRVLVHHCSDLIVPEDRAYYDYKTTSVSSMAYDKTKWEEQLNMGAYLASGHGWYLNDNGRLTRSPEIEIDTIQVIALLVDWRPSKFEHLQVSEEGSMVIDIPKWEPDRVYEWLRERAEVHMRARREGALECTDEERWQRGGWKIYPYTKGGALSKVAHTSQLFANPDKAALYAQENELSRYELKKILGKPMNCAHYCDSAPWCPQYQQILNNQ